MCDSFFFFLSIQRTRANKYQTEYEMRETGDARYAIRAVVIRLVNGATCLGMIAD